MDPDQSDQLEASESAPLRPSILLIVVSIINIIVGALAASVALVVLELLWPHSLSYTSLLLFAWALITIIGQYLGTFRRNIQGAWLSASGSPLCCAMLYFSLFILQFFTTDLSDISPSGIWGEEKLFVSIAMGIFSIASLWLNGRWAWKLKQHADGKPSWKPISISLREILALCVVLGLIMIPATLRAHANQSLYRANVSQAEAPFPVPTTAKAIIYERNREGLLLGSYEIEEAPFRRWLSRSDSEMSKHDARWHEIGKTPLTATSPTPDRLPWSLSYGNEIVADGFRVIWQADGRHHVIIYDRDAKKAYYEQLLISE